MKEVSGDLIKMAKAGEFDVIIHGCNCFCTMGAGIARQIATEFPSASLVDKMTTKGLRSKLGTITTSIEPCNIKPVVIVNAYTQYDYARGILQVNYAAVEKCFGLIKKLFGDKRIGYPKIGAGLAGGSWEEISKIIDDKLGDSNHTLVIWDREN